MPEFSTMVEALRARADRQGDRPTFAFLRNGEVEIDRLTFEELDARARGLAVTLRQFVRAGDRALLVYAPGLEFVEALFGCLYAGIVAVPVSPPRRAAFADKLFAIAQDCEVRAILTDGACREKVEQAGTFADATVVAEQSVIKVDSDLPPEIVALVSCGVATGWGSAVHRAHVGPGDVVVVVGCGGVGINAVQGAAMAGARTVVAVDPVPFKQEMAL